ncbi:S9 family peptidase [Flavihumibacter sp. CACIAM 22H1]|uniref:S9 family peptidase n=1 Tax=Flavihumibacter sp. CACIAM 22H1 TaxID=1812911 RepID=UPI000A7A626C|nr:S9 family peptidase [Flavihumibacter sp. CACIAM 22H1]
MNYTPYLKGMGWLLTLIVHTTQAQTASSQPVLVSDMLKIHQSGAVQVSKDGTTAYFTRTSIEVEDSLNWEYQYRTQVWSVATDGRSAPRQLSFSREGASQPVLSPDNRFLVFVRPVDSRPQLFLLPLQGGEAMQLTRSPYGASSPSWSPDGQKIAYIASIPLQKFLADSSLNSTRTRPSWSLEKPGMPLNQPPLAGRVQPNPDGTLEEARAWLSRNEQDKKAKVINRLQFQGEATTSGELFFNQVFLIDASAGATPVQLTQDFNNYTSVQFTSPTQLLLEGILDLPVHPDRNLARALYSIQSNGANLKLLLGKPSYAYTGARVSANGKWIALQHGKTGTVSIPELALFPINGTEKDLVAIPFDRSKAELRWKGDDQLFATVAANGGIQLLVYDVKTKKTQLIGKREEGFGAVGIGANKLVYTKTAVSNPNELYAASLTGGNELQLTRFNQEWIATRSIVQPVKDSFINEAGQAIEYWVMPPARREAGKKYPLLLQIHGGPSAMWGPGEASMWHEFQYWCSKGYGVVYANPRGSGGYGYDFLRSNINNWGKGPSSDVLTALEKVARENWVDTSRLFISGGSYAGYLVAFILAHDQRFKAACSQRGVYDLRTFFGEGNAWQLVPGYFGGYPWQPEVLQILERESPISYVDKIKTPYLIFHGENDLRTGVIQSEQLYKSLKVLERPVEYVRHPGATHEITRSGNNRQRMDQLLRTWEFFERFR